MDSAEQNTVVEKKLNKKCVVSVVSYLIFLLE